MTRSTTNAESIRAMWASSTVRVDEADAILFDLDGVLTDTATVHEHAWARMFTGFLTEVAGDRPGSPAPYTDADYFAHIDGKPRAEGVRALLRSRGIELPEGEPDDPPDRKTVSGLGNQKNDTFAEVLRTEGVRIYPGSLALLDRLADDGVPLAVVSSSRNAAAVLTAAGLLDRFELVVDGTVAAARGLAGKPAAATYLHAAERLDAAPRCTIVVEDAISGVKAGRAGGFWVTGVDRGAGRDQLLAHGADHVVDDLAELILPAPVTRPHLIPPPR